MGSIGGFYLGDHESQFDGSYYANENCTPTSGANGADNATGGKIDKTGAQVRALVPHSQETDPRTAGWSIPDLDLAMSRLGVPFENRSSRGWAAVITALNAGLYCAVQGLSAEFSNNTCSGAFNGGHCIGIHPARRVVNGLSQHWIDDPICDAGRWEYDYILKRYAAALNSGVFFGVFTHPVPKIAAPKPPVATYTLHVAAGARVHICNFVGRCIRSQTIRIWGSKPSTAPCLPPNQRAVCSGGTWTCTTVTKGAFAGQVIHLGPGVSVTKN